MRAGIVDKQFITDQLGGDQGKRAVTDLYWKKS